MSYPISDGVVEQPRELSVIPLSPNSDDYATIN